MIKTRLIIIVFLLFTMSIIGCDKYNNHPAYVLREQRELSLNINKTKQEKINEALVRTNQIVSEKEYQKIRGYIGRRKWDMRELDNGILIEETKRGDGVKIIDNDVIKLEYKLELIDGSMVYSSDKDGLKEIRFPSSNNNIELGLIYALKELSLGSKARIIIPQYYAFGLYGDGNKIPSHSTLIYEIEIIDKTKTN